jgi:D-alanyl-D-alanine carboxypeptidase
MATTSPDEQQVVEILRELGLEEVYARRKPIREASELVSVGLDIHGREQRLAPDAARAWQGMKLAAEGAGITLQLVSAFRSIDYQHQIIKRKLADGQRMEEILRVSAVPGYSEHHSGNAVDLTTTGSKPLTEEFETTPAFGWLVKNAARFTFTMSYPHGNKTGVVYEPWHWAYRGQFE